MTPPYGGECKVSAMQFGFASLLVLTCVKKCFGKEGLPPNPHHIHEKSGAYFCIVDSWWRWWALLKYGPPTIGANSFSEQFRPNTKQRTQDFT
jgi:hypothetical protein